LSSRYGRDWSAVCLLAAAVITITAWVLAAAAMSGRGFDVTDEGFYILSYRWWDANAYNFTGVQYVFGPLYQLLGNDVQSLRLARILILLTVHLGLGIAAAKWIRDTSPLPLDPTATAATVLTVMASAGVVLAWGPLSPGYNDVSVIGAAVLAAVSMESHRRATMGVRLPIGGAIALGPVLVAFTLAKWASALVTIPFVFGVTALALVKLSPRGKLPWFGALALSTTSALAAIHWALKPLPEIVAPIVTVTGSISEGSNSASALLSAYLGTTVMLAIFAVVPVSVVVAAGFASRRWSGLGASLWGVVVPILGLVTALAMVGGVRGGANGVRDYACVLVSAALSVWALVLVRSASLQARAGVPTILIMLAFLPAVQALGTGNPVFMLAINGFPLWVVILLRCWAGSPTGDGYRLGICLATCAVLVVVGWIAVSGVLLHPFRTGTYAASTSRVSADSVGSLLLAPDEARDVKALQRATAPIPEPRRVMAFDEMAGLVLLIDAGSVGEPWYSEIDPERTATGIRNYCDAHPDWWRSGGGPIVLLSRPVTTVETDTLRHCGLSFYADLRKVDAAVVPGHLDLYLPDR
jgi:hypothetical protein